MSSLTKEQKEKIEENRKKALAIRAQKINKNLNNNSIVTPGTTSKSFTSFSQNEHSSTSLSHTAKKYTVTKQSFYGTQEKRGIEFPSSKVTGNFKLISSDRFVVESGYHSQLIDIFKTIPSKKYDPSSKKWSFHLDDHQKLSGALQPLRPSVCIAPLPKTVLNNIGKYTKCSPSKDVDLSNLDPLLLEAFMPFQRDGVCFGVSRGGRVLIADDMGLGKTVQALGIASYYSHEWPLLVVTPSSVRYSWADAIERWISSVDSESVKVVNTGKDSLYADVVIISYDILSRRAQELQDIKFKVVIMDESHMLKNSKTARTKAAMPIMKSARRVILLSGTPALSRPMELFPQLNGISSSLLPSYQEFGIRYCSGKKNPWGWDFSGSSNLEELQVLLESTVMIRRLKSQVMDQLPSKQRMTVILDPSAIKTSSKAMKDAAKNFQCGDLKGVEKHGALLQFFAETAQAKKKAVSDYVKDLLEDGKKFLIFSHHRIMMDEICVTCNEMKIRYIRIDGSTQSEDRQKLVDHFQANDDTKVAVLSITAASTGLTLTAAQLVVFAELYWNPGVLVQAEDRVHRIGQTDSVLVQYLVGKGTADDHIWPMIQSKLDVLNKAGLSKANFSSAESSMQRNAKENSCDQTAITNFFKKENVSASTLDSSEMLQDLLDEDCLREFFEDEPCLKKPKIS